MSQQLQAVFQLTDKPIVSINPKELKEHPLNISLFGELSKEDYQSLKRDIQERGIQDPLHITKDNVVISGHQRRKIALELGIDCPCIVRKDLVENWQVEEQLINDNLLRRHLTDYQKVECGELLYKIEEKKAELERRKKISHYRSTGKTNLISDSSKMDTVKDVGEKIGLKRDKYSKARKVYNEAPEPIKEQWKQGDITTNKAYKQLQCEKKKEQRKQPTETPDLPDKKYDVVYADPPWKYPFHTSISREIEQNYPTMTMDELKQLELPVNDNAVLYLWATAPLLKRAIELMEYWGFEYKTNAVWDKEKIGMGFWFRGQHEILLVGTKGDFSPPETEKRVGSVFRIPRTEHSKKPNEVRDHIANCFLDRKKIELFAREKHPGWDVWGDDI